MVPHFRQAAWPPSAYMKEAADLLEGLEALREELGSIADELIVLLRQAGITPLQAPRPTVH